MKVTLTVGEMLAIGDLDGVAAIWAVAKALNVYPPMPEELPDTPLISKDHYKIQVVYSKVESKTYRLSHNRGDFFVLIIGAGNEFDIKGYWKPENLMKTEDTKEIIAYQHLLNGMGTIYFFLELLDNSRDWTHSYSISDGKMIPLKK